MEDLEEKEKVEMILSGNVFSFGNNKKLKSEGRYLIPAEIKITCRLEIYLLTKKHY